MSRSSTWDGMIVLCAAVRWDGVRMQDRQMAEHLRGLAPVLYVDPPVSHLTRFKNAEVAASMKRPRLRELEPGLARLTPVVPPKPTHPLMAGVARQLARRQIRQAVRSLGGSVQALVTTWLFLDVYGACGEEVRVYSWSDDPVAAADLWGEKAERLAAADERLARASDLVVAVSKGGTERLMERGFPAVHLPNGCDTTIFRDIDSVTAAKDVALDGPVAVFVGHLNGRTDLALLEAVADAGIGLLLVGPHDGGFEPERVARLIARSNVVSVGRRPYEQLASYFKLGAVGLVPYVENEFNNYSFPMKTLEYLSAGLPVVATPLPEIEALDTSLIALAATPDEFVRAVREQAMVAHDADQVAERRAFAAAHSWDARARRLLELIEERLDQVRAGSVRL
jgi:teichuronic acid biosynthesis glycosyltransferase TuaH